MFWSRLAVALGGVVLLGAVATAEARLRPRLAAFASVVRGAEFDPLAAGDNLRTEERAFLRTAIEACRQEARLAQLGVAQATRSDVRTFAQELATDARQMADTLDTVARRKGVVLVPDNGATHPAYARLTEITGADFDREFVLTAAATTEDLVKLFDQSVSTAKDADIRDTAGSQLPTLRAHSNRIVELRKALE